MSFIPPPSAIRSIMANAPNNAINLAIGEPVYPPPTEVLRAVAEKVAYWSHGYSPNAGLPALREIIASQYEPTASADEICVTCGAQEALYVVCHTLLDRGDQALVPNPGFLAYPNLVRMAGGSPIEYPMPLHSGERFDIEALRRLISNRTRLMIVNSPSNPNGYCLKESELAEIAGLCASNGIIIVSDEVYRELYFGKQRPSGVRAVWQDCVTISSVSKMFSMTGWRLGWAAAPRHMMPAFTRVHQYLTTCAPVISQQATLTLLQHPATPEYLSDMRKELKKRRDMLSWVLRNLPEWHVNPPNAGLFLFAQVAPDWQESPAEIMLEKYQILSVPGNAFGSRGRGFLRLSFAAAQDAIKRAGERLNQADSYAAGDILAGK